MKNMLLPLCLTAALLCGWRMLEGSSITYAVPFNYIARAETSAVDPIIVVRRHQDDSVRLEVPSGGTGTSAILYRDWDSSLQAPLGTTKSSGGHAPPALDMTGLKDGNYTLHYLSCGAGAVMHVVLATKDSL